MPYQYKAILVSDFNLANFASYLENDEELIGGQAKLAPFGQVMQVLMQKNMECWKDSYDFAVVWTRPEAVIESFAQILRHEKVNLEKLLPELFQGGDWDFFLVVAYGKIIPKNVLDIPRLGTLNVHPSLLPRHRGPTPIQTAILNGDEITGVSIILLDEEVDHGPILAQKQLKVESLKLKALERTLANLGVKMLVEILPKFMEGELTPVAQEHAKATFTKKFTTDDAFVSCEHLISALSGDKDKALHIDRMIRALNPEPGVWTRTTDVQILDFPKNKRIKLLESGVREGRLKLRGIQVEGRKPRELLISNG